MAASALPLLEARALIARRTWRSAAISAVLHPLLYLLAVGLGIGAVVDPAAAAALPGGSYLAFIAPALLVASAMQIGANESMWALMVGIEWRNTYHAVAATPLRPWDITLGHIGFGLVRVLLSSIIIAVVILGFVEGIPLGGTIIAIGVAIAVGLAFSAPILWLTATIRNHAFLTGLLRFGIVPLFLFSGTFFPIDRLPGWLQPIAWASPLWHGVELARAAMVDAVTPWPVWAHLGVLVALSGAGLALGERAMRRVLHR